MTQSSKAALEKIKLRNFWCIPHVLLISGKMVPLLHQLSTCYAYLMFIMLLCLLNDDKVIENKYLLNLKSRRECLKKTLQRGIISCLKKDQIDQDRSAIRSEHS